MLFLSDLPLWGIALAFGVAAVLIWASGTRLAAYAEELADRTGIGQAFAGALLLGGVTSLPEAATTVSASAIGNAPLAVNNIFGGIALQIAILALADWVARGRALSSRIDDDSVLLQSALLIGVLAVAITGILVPDRLVMGVGVWSLSVFGAAVVGFYLIHRHGTPGRWRPQATAAMESTPAEAAPGGTDAEGLSTTGLILRISLSGLVILAAGYMAATSADLLAERTGIDANFMGAVALALATSLPEVSTALGAVRIGAYAMAYANIFGANILDAALILLADAVYTGPAVLNQVGLAAAFVGLLAVLLTAVWLVGLVKRRGRVMLGLGVDSGAVLLLYLAGIGFLFTLS